VLNLSIPEDGYTHATGFSAGKPVILSKSENMPHSSRFQNLFVQIGKISGLLSKNSHMLYCIEYRLSETVNYKNKQEVFLDVLAFVSEIMRIRNKNKINVVILAPINRHAPGKTASEYIESATRVNYIQSVLALTCSKFFLPVVINNGEITSIGLQNVSSGPWSTYRFHNSEPLYNHGGTSTRELKICISLQLDRIARAWAKTIPQIPNLRVKYSQNITKGYYEFDKSICNLGAEGQICAEQRLDTVD
jgi:hypothetical protein